MNILNNFTLKHLKLNKKRTIVSIVGILLSTALMVGIGLLISSLREVMIDDVKQYEGNYNIKISNLLYNDLEKLNEYKEIDNMFYSEEIGFAKFNSINDYKPYLYVTSVNDEYLKELKLINGVLPTNEHEVVISDHINNSGWGNYKIGDTLNLRIGQRISEGYRLDNDVAYSPYEEDIVNDKNYTYTIVGIVSRSVYEAYIAPGYSVFTTCAKNEGIISAYINFKKPKNSYEYADELASLLNKEKYDDSIYEDIEFNNDLLSLYGASKYDNFNTTAISLMSIILFIIGVGCTVVIYNSFAISVTERKKQFGLLASVGTTKKQILKSVLFEALIVGVIGIILGIMCSFLGIGLVILVINNLLADMLDITIKLTYYPLYIIIPLTFMIIVIFISAYIPALKASKVSPIEAIRGNDDIKIKAKKIKSNKIINKLFGIEGELAYKNIKRNKKKYRITILSLVVSIVLFISFSSFADYIIGGTEVVTGNVDYDLSFYYSPSENEDLTILNKIRNNSDVKDSILISGRVFATLNKNTSNLNKIYTENLTEDMDMLDVIIIKLDNKDYMDLLKKHNLENNESLIINKYDSLTVQNNNMHIKEGIIFDNNNQDLDVCVTIYDASEFGSTEETNYCDIPNIDNYYLIDEVFSIDGNDSIQIIMSEENYDKMIESIPENTIGVQDKRYYLNIKAPKYDSILKEYEDLIKTSNEQESYFYSNFKESKMMLNNILLVVNILVYGFIALVTLIGVTSVLNTISTSISLRRKEFAMLRSVGLTPKGFNKMIRFESIFFGLKALLYGLPISFGLIYLFHNRMEGIISFSSLLIPWSNIVIAIISVFVIVFISMTYATSKIKKNNILEDIRNENI